METEQRGWHRGCSDPQRRRRAPREGEVESFPQAIDTAAILCPYDQDGPLEEGLGLCSLPPFRFSSTDADLIPSFLYDPVARLQSGPYTRCACSGVCLPGVTRPGVPKFKATRSNHRPDTSQLIVTITVRTHTKNGPVARDSTVFTMHIFIPFRTPSLHAWSFRSLVYRSSFRSVLYSIRHSFAVSRSPPESHAEHRVLMVSWLRPIPSTFFPLMCICPFPPRPHIPSHNPFTVAVSTRTCCSPSPIIAMSPHIRFQRSLFSAHVPSCIISYLTHITISTTIVLSLRTWRRIASRTHCTPTQILKSKETPPFPFMLAR